MKNLSDAVKDAWDVAAKGTCYMDCYCKVDLALVD